LFVVTVCWAADTSDKQPKEFEVYKPGRKSLVSARNKPRSRKVARSVDVITAGGPDIKRPTKQPKTVAEALSNAPGVRVTTGAKNNPSVSIHGFAQTVF